MKDAVYLLTSAFLNCSPLEEGISFETTLTSVGLPNDVSSMSTSNSLFLDVSPIAQFTVFISSFELSLLSISPDHLLPSSVVRDATLPRPKRHTVITGFPFDVTTRLVAAGFGTTVL